MSLSNEQIRICLLYDFKSGLTAANSQRKLCAAFSEDLVSERAAQKHFQRFRSGDFGIEDKPRSGRPSAFDDDMLRELVESNPHKTSRELAEEMDVSHTTVITHLHSIGKVSKLDRWVPHELSDAQRQRRVEAAVSLLSYSRRTDWLNTIIIGDEKWCMYTNVRRRRSWTDAASPPATTAKAEMHQRKVMLSVWWDSKGIVYWELLPQNVTVTSQVYCTQLDRLATSFAQKRPNVSHVRFLHDNARPHTARGTREKLLELGWEILVHPPYSPDLAPSDDHLFRSLSNDMAGKTFEDDEQLKLYLTNFFDTKPAKFYYDGIHLLPHKWRACVDSDGNYFN